MKYKYIESINKNKYQLNELHDKILEIVVYFDNFCKEHNLKYYLMGGTALGAVRHGGFIPWDDDFDVFMPYEDYCKLISLKEKIDNELFYLQIEDTEELPNFFTKLRMNGTLFLETELVDDNIERHCGIFIDIMCLNRAPNSKFGQLLQYLAGGVLKASALSKYKYKTSSVLKKSLIKFSSILTTKRTKKYLLRFVRKFNYQDTHYVAHVFGRAPFSRSFYKSSDFSEIRYMKFERLSLPVAVGVHNYLEVRYGPNYLKIPSKKTREKYGKHATYWNVDCTECK